MTLGSPARRERKPVRRRHCLSAAPVELFRLKLYHRRAGKHHRLPPRAVAGSSIIRHRGHSKRRSTEHGHGQQQHRERPQSGAARARCPYLDAARLECITAAEATLSRRAWVARGAGRPVSGLGRDAAPPGLAPNSTARAAEDTDGHVARKVDGHRHSSHPDRHRRARRHPRHPATARPGLRGANRSRKRRVARRGLPGRAASLERG